MTVANLGTANAAATKIPNSFQTLNRQRQRENHSPFPNTLRPDKKPSMMQAISCQTLSESFQLLLMTHYFREWHSGALDKGIKDSWVKLFLSIP